MKRRKDVYFVTLARHLHSQKSAVLQENLSEQKQTYYQH